MCNSLYRMNQILYGGDDDTPTIFSSLQMNDDDRNKIKMENDEDAE